MVKFSDFKNSETNSGKPGNPKGRHPSNGNSRLSFRKLAAEQKATLSTDQIVAERKYADKDRIIESGGALYQNAAAYLKQVFEAVKRRKMFSLDPGMQIIREMVEIQSFQDDLFIEALHFDDPLQFIIHNNINVAVYAIRMAENLGFDKNRQVEIGMAGLLHDVGMAVIPEKLIFKQQKLSEAEFKIFKERSNYAYKILKSLGNDYAYLAECAIQVNERLDGSGYPQGLQGDEINENAQIIGLVDMYEALIHSRPQREKFHHFTAVKEIIKSGKHLFQRKHLKALLNIFSIFPLRSYVRLNSNAIGRVIDTYPDLPMRPKLQIIFDSQQRRVLTERIVNLPDESLLYIVDSVSDEELQQLSEGTHKESQIQIDIVPKEDDSDAAEIETTTVEDELPTDIQKAKDSTETHRKTGRLKYVLIIGAIILLVIGLMVQFGNKGQKPFDAGKLGAPVIKKQPNNTPVKKPADNTPLSAVKSQLPKKVVQEKAAAVQPSDLKDSGVDYKENAARAPQTDSRRSETIVPEKAVAEKEKASLSESKGAQAAPLASSSEPVLDTEPIIHLYPFSIKLTYFRTRKAAEQSLAVYRQKGLSPYWVKVNLGDQGIWYRVFAGFFKDAEQAENIIKAKQLTRATVKKTRYANLVGRYRAETDANEQVQSISKHSFSPYVVKQANNEYYIYVGAFYTRKGAQDQYADLMAAGIKSKVVER